MNPVAATSVKPLSIAVIGVGGIGSAYAHRLALAGHNVTVVARAGSTRLEQLKRDKGVVDNTGAHVDMHVADTLDGGTVYDLVVVTTLAHQVDAVLPSLQRSKASCIQFMFNNFEPERLKAAMGDREVSFGMPFLMATIDNNGKLVSSIGPGQKSLHGDKRWTDLFNQAGIPSAFEPNITLWLRCHVPMCIAMESISVAGQRSGDGASWAESMIVARGLRGGYAIIKGLGYQIYPSAKVIISSSPVISLAAMLWSVSRIKSFRELLSTGANECRALIDVVATDAQKAKLAKPDAIAALLASKPQV